MKQALLESLIQNLIDGALSQDQFDQLDAELRSNPASMATYLAYVDLDNMMVLELEEKRHNFGSVVPIERIIHRQKKRAFRTALLAAAAVVLLSLIGMRLFFIDTTRPPTLAFQTCPGTHFTITHDQAADAEDQSLSQQMEKGSRLQISHGVVELSFASGVKSIITAPADVTLHEDDVLFLNHGIAWFHVPENAIGFQVKTPNVVVTDLGTEFGVISSNDRLDEVHVFDGKVEVVNRNSLRHKEVLTAQHARMVGAAGRLKATPLRVADFRKSLPTQDIPMIVFQDQFDSEGSGWLVEGKARFVSGAYEVNSCRINTDGEDDHSGFHFNNEGREISALGNGYMALGHDARPSGNAVFTKISVERGKSYTVYFRYTGSHNSAHRVTASLTLGTETSGTGELQAPDALWKSASFTFIPDTSGEAVLKFEDTGSSEGASADLLIDSVVVTSRLHHKRSPVDAPHSNGLQQE